MAGAAGSDPGCVPAVRGVDLDPFAFHLAGASAVEVGTAFFRNLDVGKEISEGLERYVSQYSCSSLEEMKGLARK